MLLFFAWWKRRRITGADLRATAAFFAVSLGLGLVTVWFQLHRAIGPEPLVLGGAGTRLAGAGHAVGCYLSRFIFPVELLPIYPRWTVDPTAYSAFVPWLVGGAMLYGLWSRRATWGRHVLLGGGCFLINLAPVLGFVPMSYLRISWVADHLAYLPLAGLAGLAAAGAGAVELRLPAWLHSYAFTGVVLVLGLFAVQAHRHADVFCSDEKFWTYLIERKTQTDLAHYNLGLIASRAGRTTEAIDHYQEALRIKPDYAEAHNNLGHSLAQAGRAQEAIDHYQEALRIKPDFAEVHYNLANVLSQLQRLPEATRHYQEALRIKPDYFEAHHNQANMLAQAGRLGEAMAEYEQALRIKPDFARAHCNLGNVLLQLGRLPEAILHYEQALQSQPDLAEARHNLEWAREQALPQEGR